MDMYFDAEYHIMELRCKGVGELTPKCVSDMRSAMSSNLKKYGILLCRKILACNSAHETDNESWNIKRHEKYTRRPTDFILYGVSGRAR